MDRELCQRLHEATLVLLERLGVRIESDEALSLLADHGVPVDWPVRRAHPRAEDIDRALATAPRLVELYGRRTRDPLRIGGDQVYIVSGGGSLRVLTLEGVYEPSSWEHLRSFNVLLDALPNIHLCINQVDPQDDGGPGFYRRLAAEMLCTQPKPCSLQSSGPDDVRAFIEMGTALRGSREALAAKPVFRAGGNAEPPLCIPGNVAEVLITAARAGVPSGIGDYSMMGITSPATVAGAVVQLNAIQMTALVLSQAARPGAGVGYSTASGSGNMRTLDPVTADPQTAQFLRLAIGLGHYYGLPVSSVALTDARAPDPQAAAERTLQLQTVVEAGAHQVQGPTSHMDQMMLSSYAQAVIDDDIVGYVLASRARPEVNEDTLAFEAIADVISDPALKDLKFAAHPHTVRRVRRQTWQPRAFSAEAFGPWESAGRVSVVERATAVARDILAHHRPEPLEPALEREIRRIAQAGV